MLLDYLDIRIFSSGTK